ncbi:hypothetical protein BD779DRAFT_214578 [Infundibulicybe gibba]|nr:hypothetical protein BD779DRAFT_214578 [Infundibulicybe gibba]
MRHCKLNPARVEIICPACRKEFSRGDSLTRHLHSPTACSGAQPDTPASVPRSASPCLAPGNHHVSLYYSSPISKSDQDPGSPHTHYTNNDYARDMARQLGLPLLTPSSPSIPRYTTKQANTVIYNENDEHLPFSRNVCIPQNISEYQYNALVSTPPYRRSWSCGVFPGENRPLHTIYSGAAYAEWADEQLANGQSNNSSLEHMDSQAAGSTPRNHGEFFPPSEHGFDSQAQHQSTASCSAQEYHGHFLGNQPTSHTTGPARPRTMLEELLFIGEDIYPSGE